MLVGNKNSLWSKKINEIDADALAFVNAANITDYAYILAINTLVTMLKANSIWSKMKAIYPFVGGISASHKFNLKDPRDLDEAFRLTFNGVVTHSSSGIQGDGSTGYADTHLNELNELTLGSEHLCIYSKTDLNKLSVDLGLRYNSLSYGSQIFPRYNGNFTTRCQSSELSGSTTNVSNSLGLFMISRTSLSSYYQQYNDSQYLKSVSVSSLGNYNFYLLARNSMGVSQNFSDRLIAFATIGDGLNSVESLILYNIIQTFQTTLGRNV